jgi:hypothetical protein
LYFAVQNILEAKIESSKELEAQIEHFEQWWQNSTQAD